MSDETEQNQGLQVAHTPPENFPGGDPERAAKVGSVTALAEAAMAGLAQSLASGQAEAEQQSLLLDEMDEQQSLFAGPVAHVASTISDARRARGRPKGSQNKASREFAATLMRMGYRHPGLNLAALANADPVRLAVELAGARAVEGVTAHEHLDALVHTGSLKRDQVIGLIDKAQGLIMKANAELLPYFESKQATKVEIEEKQLGVMIIGQMPTERPAAGAALDLTRVDAPREKDQ
ncbi:hypothetical protein DXT96_07400 [Agrobacterium sp. ICMP 6402]|uniref:hypothetical protein n=1 Tax=Agrobacterium sp. ICMP 6402 TaxID=2292443 RepID=UPI00129808EB|nr:hypothetical protein [Agrobacterium sp. ICMP 6402]MQB09679.1 hypothetical protein [Agrobacterium sp. ICMP 6402]